MSGRI